jgi:2-oxoglutarate dehydrogenase E1 component
MNYSMQELWGSSHLSAGHAAYLESLYETFLNNPDELSEEWLQFFTSLKSDPNGKIDV